MTLNKDYRERIEAKYKDCTSDSILVYLKRISMIYLIRSEHMNCTITYIMINGKSYSVKNNKKNLKQKLLSILNPQFYNIEEKIRVKTIKKFLDMVLGID